MLQTFILGVLRNPRVAIARLADGCPGFCDPCPDTVLLIADLTCMCHSTLAITQCIEI